MQHASEASAVLKFLDFLPGYLPKISETGVQYMFILLLWDRAFPAKRNEPKSGSRIKRLFGWGIFLTVVWGGLATAATLPAGTVTVVSTTSPVVRSTPGIAITAN